MNAQQEANVSVNAQQETVVIIGGGPGGYEAAIVARRTGARVVVIEENGLGGSAVLTDVVPSKTLIASAEWLKIADRAEDLHIYGDHDDLEADILGINKRVLEVATSQSEDIRARIASIGIEIVVGRGVLATNLADGGRRIVRCGEAEFVADYVLISTGAHPRELPDAKPDGARILTWKQLYDLDVVPEHLIVVGSGVTGAEFASSYQTLGVQVSLVSSRDRVLPNQDRDAADFIERVFEEAGMHIYSRSRAMAARVEGDRVVVTLSDGREITGSHCLMAVGAIPNTSDIGLTEAGVQLDRLGCIPARRVSRTSAHRVYAAGDCTGVYPLASVAAAQGRIAMAHALGETVEPIDLKEISAAIFTAPEIATVGVTQEQIDSGEFSCLSVTVPLGRNPRAKMRGVNEGFIKLFARPSTRTIAGGVVVSPSASEFIYPIALAVKNRLTADDLAQTFTVYPSISGSIAEAARQLRSVGGDVGII